MIFRLLLSTGEEIPFVDFHAGGADDHEQDEEYAEKDQPEKDRRPGNEKKLLRFACECI